MAPCRSGEHGNSGAILIHPEDPDLVYVAAIGNPFAPSPERGVYRSRDGGTTWDNILFVSDSTGATDLEFAPDDPNTIYASMWRGERKPWTIISGAMEGGVYRSTDGGDTWEQATSGLPAGLRGKSDLAVSAADPDRVYVLIEAPAEAGGVYRSDDRGVTWRQVTDFQPIRNRAFYYTNLDAHPTNPDILWGMAEGFWKSEDGGQTWAARPSPTGTTTTCGSTRTTRTFSSSPTTAGPTCRWTAATHGLPSTTSQRRSCTKSMSPTTSRTGFTPGSRTTQRSLSPACPNAPSPEARSRRGRHTAAAKRVRSCPSPVIRTSSTRTARAVLGCTTAAPGRRNSITSALRTSTGITRRTWSTASSAWSRFMSPRTTPTRSTTGRSSCT